MTLDLNFITKNKGHVVFIDVGNQLIKIGYLNAQNEWIVNRLQTRDSSIADLDNVFKKIRIIKVYLGSVVLEIKRYLINYFDSNDIAYELITNDMFQNRLPMQKNINLNEVGTDILGFAYLIKDYKNVLAINFGTATVAIDYNQRICGVTIGIDFFNSYKNLLKTINIPIELETYHDFGIDTKQAFYSSRYFLINGFINHMLKMRPNITTIIYTGGNRRIFNAYENINHCEIIEIDEAVLKGYKALIDHIKHVNQ